MGENPASARQRPELPVAQLHGEGPRDGAEQLLTLLGRGRRHRFFAVLATDSQKSKAADAFMVVLTSYQ